VLEAMRRPLPDGSCEGGEGIVTDLVERLPEAAAAVIEGTCYVERELKAGRG